MDFTTWSVTLYMDLVAPSLQRRTEERSPTYVYVVVSFEKDLLVDQ